MNKRQPQIEHAVLVYLHRGTGDVQCRYVGEIYYPPAGYEHVASLDPALWIAAHYNEVGTEMERASE